MPLNYSIAQEDINFPYLGGLIMVATGHVDGKTAGSDMASGHFPQLFSARFRKLFRFYMPITLSLLICGSWPVCDSARQMGKELLAANREGTTICDRHDGRGGGGAMMM